MPHEHRALGHVKGSKSYRNAADQHQVEYIGAYDISEGKCAVALEQGCDRRDQFRKAGSQRHKSKSNDRLRNTQSLRDQCSVFHQEIGADCDQGCSQHKKDQDLAHCHVFFMLFFLFRDRLRAVLHGPDIDDHVAHEYRQHDKAHRSCKASHRIGRDAVDRRGYIEECHRHFQCFGICGAGMHRYSDRRDQGCVAYYGADRVSVSDLAVTGQSRHGGDHDFRKRSSDRNDCRADQQLGQIEFSCQRARAVHEPVAALDKACKTNDE